MGDVSLWCKNVLFVSIFLHFPHLLRHPGLGEGAQHLQRYNSAQNQMSECICQPSFHTNSALQAKISVQGLWLGCFSAHQEWWGILSTGLKRGLNSLKSPDCDQSWPQGDRGTLLCGHNCVAEGTFWRLKKPKQLCGHRFYSQQSWFLHPLLQLCHAKAAVLYLGRQLHLSQV